MNPLMLHGCPQDGSSVREHLERETRPGFMTEASSQGAGFNAAVPSWKTLLTEPALDGIPQQADSRRIRVSE